MWVDGKQIDETYENYQTHREVSSKIHELYEVDLAGYSEEEAIRGRLFDLGNNLVVSTWNTYAQITKFGMDRFMEGLKPILRMNGWSIDTVLYNPYNDTKLFDLDQTFTHQQMTVGMVSSGEEKKKETMKLLHLLDPSFKAAYMKQQGISPKTPSKTPDFVKKQNLGIDENER